MSTDVAASATDIYDAAVAAPAAGDPRTSASVRNPLSNLANRSRWLWNRLQEVIGSFLPLAGLFPVAASVGSSIFTIAGHGLSANDPVRVQSIGGAVPTGLSAALTYFAVNVTTNTFKLAITSGGSAITLSDVGSGAIYVTKIGARQNAVSLAAYSGAVFSIAVESIQTVMEYLADHTAIVNLAGTTRHVLNIFGATSGKASQGLSLTLAGNPAILTAAQQGANAEKSLVELRGIANQATITSLSVTSTGITINGSLTVGTYKIQMISLATGASSDLSAAVSDDHNSGNWLTTRTTTVTPTAPIVVDNSSTYVLLHVHPSSASSGGANIEIADVAIHYTPSGVLAP